MEIRFVVGFGDSPMLGYIATSFKNDLAGDGSDYLNVVSIFICRSIYVFLVVSQKTISSI
jgi:hypothetical protein